MSFSQLSSPLPVYIVEKGRGMCFGVIDYGPEHNLIWVTALDDSGEIWCAPNPMVRMQANWTLGRERSAAEQSARDAALPKSNLNGPNLNGHCNGGDHPGGIAKTGFRPGENRPGDGFN